MVWLVASHLAIYCIVFSSVIVEGDATTVMTTMICFLHLSSLVAAVLATPLMILSVAVLVAALAVADLVVVGNI